MPAPLEHGRVDFLSCSGAHEHDLSVAPLRARRRRRLLLFDDQVRADPRPAARPHEAAAHACRERLRRPLQPVVRGALPREVAAHGRVPVHAAAAHAGQLRPHGSGLPQRLRLARGRAVLRAVGAALRRQQAHVRVLRADRRAADHGQQPARVDADHDAGTAPRLQRDARARDVPPGLRRRLGADELRHGRGALHGAHRPQRARDVDQAPPGHELGAVGAALREEEPRALRGVRRIRDDARPRARPASFALRRNRDT